MRAPTGALAVDLRGKAPGRGAYLCPDEACLERGLRDGALGRALEMAIDGGAQETLRHALADAARERKKTMAGRAS